MQKKPLTKFNTKALKKLGIEGLFPNIIKAIYEKYTTTIILNGEKFPLKSGLWKACPLSSLLFSTVLEFLARAMTRKRKYQESK
jgi:hypothetical protein